MIFLNLLLQGIIGKNKSRKKNNNSLYLILAGVFLWHQIHPQDTAQDQSLDLPNVLSPHLDIFLLNKVHVVFILCHWLVHHLKEGVPLMLDMNHILPIDLVKVQQTLIHQVILVFPLKVPWNSQQKQEIQIKW